MADVQENQPRNFVGYVRLPDAPCCEAVWRQAEREAHDMAVRKLRSLPYEWLPRMTCAYKRIDDHPDGRMVQVIVGPV